MKYLIISDIHGSYYYLNKALKVFKKEKCDKILILGDVLYHGPRNDLPKQYAPKKIIPLLNELKDKIICVRGNCDAEVDQMVLKFPIRKAKEIDDNIVAYLTHGHKINPQNPYKKKKVDVVLFGHSHIHEITNVDGVTYINPGSISIPKGDKINSYAIWENNTISIYNLLTGDTLMEYTK